MPVEYVSGSAAVMKPSPAGVSPWRSGGYSNVEMRQKSTGPRKVEGKQHSRCNAAPRGLAAETLAGSQEDAQDCIALEAAVAANCDAQSAYFGGFGLVQPSKPVCSRSR